MFDRLYPGRYVDPWHRRPIMEAPAADYGHEDYDFAPPSYDEEAYDLFDAPAFRARGYHGGYDDGDYSSPPGYRSYRPPQHRSMMNFALAPRINIMAGNFINTGIFKYGAMPYGRPSGYPSHPLPYPPVYGDDDTYGDDPYDFPYDEDNDTGDDYEVPDYKPPTAPPPPPPKYTPPKPACGCQYKHNPNPSY